MARDLPDSAQHAGEQPRVEREEPVPVGHPEDAGRLEDRRLANRAARSILRDLELKPGAARELHFRAKSQQPVGFDRLDPPEVDGRPDGELLGITPAAAEAYPAAEQVENAAYVPERVTEVPPGLSADTPDGSECRSGSDGDMDRAGVDQPLAEAGAAIPVGSEPRGGERVRPTRLGELVVLVLQCASDRLA